ncbi:MAG: hypothetical protein CMK59_15205 [Proteobacteria bacterium]|nr:hypothetical protein [Pseudomonadota bacterium]
MMLLFSTLLTSTSLADTKKPKKQEPNKQEASAFSTTGELRILGSLPPNFAVDSEGTMVGQGFVLENRLRAGAQYTKENWKASVQADLFTGQIAGDPWDLEGNLHRLHPETIGVLNPHNFALREANVSGKLGKLYLQTGMMKSSWGLGLMANDGETNQVFGKNDYGDRVLRTTISTRPIKPLLITVGGDWVVEDDLGAWSDDQLAFQGLLSSQFFFSKTNKLGIFVVYRHQTEAIEEQYLKGWLVDLFGTTTYEVGDYKMTAAFEGAYLFGESNRINNRNNPDGLKIQSYAALTKLQVIHQKIGDFAIRAGYASGDSDPYDDTMRTFTFDRDSNAGLLLFDQYQSAIEMGQYNEITNPKYSEMPPSGIEATITEGAIRQAMFINPTWLAPITQTFSVKTGSVVVWNTAPVAYGFETHRNGGVPTNRLGEPTDGYYLGTELDWGIVYKHQINEMTGSVIFEGAHLLPSDNLTDEGLLSLYRAQLRLNW